VFAIKGELLGVLEEIGAPVAALQTVQGQEGRNEAPSWWHPGRSARLQLGPKTTLAAFGAIHPSVLKALDVAGPIYAFEAWLDAVPEPRASADRARGASELSVLMPLSRDFAFVVDKARAAGDLVRAAQSVDKTLISGVRVFDVYEGPGVPEGAKSVALEVMLQPRDKTLTEAEIEALSARIVAAVGKAAGAKLRG
jgi:phenylalanyl-tRNA synthetase beta chain